MRVACSQTTHVHSCTDQYISITSGYEHAQQAQHLPRWLVSGPSINISGTDVRLDLENLLGKCPITTCMY